MCFQFAGAGKLLADLLSVPVAGALLLPVLCQTALPFQQALGRMRAAVEQTLTPKSKPWRCAQACWARVRPDKDQAARAAAAASATEDLLASVAVTDVRELARRQKAYVADRRAEGISESFARVRGPCKFLGC